ncbi:hypothetical protein MTP99_012007 [Tenebrio molitor]|nr:hypothetical protein MTP99_012007 [Tenebrio molitor]
MTPGVDPKKPFFAVAAVVTAHTFGRNGLKISATALINRRPPEKSGTAGGRVVPLARCQATGGVRIPRKARRAVRVGQWRRTFHVGTVYGVSRPSTLLHTGGRDAMK